MQRRWHNVEHTLAAMVAYLYYALKLALRSFRALFDSRSADPILGYAALLDRASRQAAWRDRDVRRFCMLLLGYIILANASGLLLPAG